MNVRLRDSKLENKYFSIPIQKSITFCIEYVNESRGASLLQLLRLIGLQFYMSTASLFLVFVSNIRLITLPK